MKANEWEKLRNLNAAYQELLKVELWASSVTRSEPTLFFEMGYENECSFDVPFPVADELVRQRRKQLEQEAESLGVELE